MDKYRILKDLINNEETLVVPDAYDAVTASLIEIKKSYDFDEVVKNKRLLDLKILSEIMR